MQEILEAIERARGELERSPSDRVACARARGALSQAREAWGALDAAQRAELSGPAGALRAAVDAIEGDPLGASPPPEPEELLARFGLNEFRPGQREAVAAALTGRDSLVVMPTGAGKSLCYQLPALAGRGLVVVVSPLIALMSDQYKRLQQTEVRAVMLASGTEEGHNARALMDVESGWAQLVLASPERFASRAFREAIATRRVGLFVVDEAHCVAEWGHDFRPDYLRLHGAIAALGRPPVMAATATATPRVAQEIAARLGLREWVAVSSGFDRPNLAFDVVRLEGKGAVERKRRALLHVLENGLPPAAGSPPAQPAGQPTPPAGQPTPPAAQPTPPTAQPTPPAAQPTRPAIVYCGTRKDTEEVAELIAGRGIATVAYHAGLSAQRRRAAQEAFMEGRAEVVVATNAFGMGVDKADVRTVVHWAIPTSLEAYYQEAGRGGRDGRPARAVLLASRMDLGRLIRFNTDRQSTVEDVRAYVERLRRRAQAGAAPRDPGEPPRRPAGAVAEIAPGELDDEERVLLSIAERAGAAELQPGARGVLRVHLTGQLDGRAAYQAIKAARDRGWEAYRAIERFIANGSECHRRQILEHFGDSTREPLTGRCCSVCDPDPELERALAAPAAHPNRRTAREAPNGHEAPEPVDEHRYEQLRAWRLTRAEGKPAYTVAPNRVLEEILRQRPGSIEEMIEIHGIGPAFCEKHGESLLEALAAL